MKKNTKLVLTIGLGAVTCYLVKRGVGKAREAFATLKQEKGEDYKPTTKEVVKIVAKAAAPAVALGTATLLVASMATVDPEAAITMANEATDIIINTETHDVVGVIADEQAKALTNDLYYDTNDAIKYISTETSIEPKTVETVLDADVKYMESVGIITPDPIASVTNDGLLSTLEAIDANEVAKANA